MAQYQTRTIESTRYEWVLRTPTNPAEYAKAYCGAEQKAKQLGVAVTYDDWLTLDVGDDEIILSFTVEKVAGQ